MLSNLMQDYVADIEFEWIIGFLLRNEFILVSGMRVCIFYCDLNFVVFRFL